MILEPIFIIIFVQGILNILIINFWKSPKMQRYHDLYQAEQKIHEGFIPRFGGLTMLISLCIVSYFEILSEYENDFFILLLKCMTPLIFVTFLEDIYNNIQPLARLFVIFLSALLILTIGSFPLPEINFPLISYFFIENSFVLILLLTIATASMVNAFNLIDGSNGLLLFTFISILGCLFMMAGFVNDNNFISLLQILLIICVCQIPFNFPIARMFAGDLGAYAFGYVIAIIVIIFFGKHAEFLTWQAILILFYPAFELLFTIIRRLLTNKNPLKADRLHLHQLIFKILYFTNKNNILSNALTTTVLLPLWGFAFLWIFINGAQLDLLKICWGLFANSFLYIIYYLTAINLNNYIER